MDAAALRQHLLQALGPYMNTDPERLVYEYDATWECEFYGGAYTDCPEAAEDEAEGEWCRSCKAKKWLKENRDDTN